MGTTKSKNAENRLRQLGKYELIARIAAGGMAEVYLARQLGLMNFQKVVVVKLIHPHLSSEKQFVDMFLDEARISALIKHHNVVDIYDLGLDGDTYFIAMEYIAGQALSRVISAGSKGKRLDVFTSARIIAEAATGLDAAHNLTSITGERVELVHRDVSPGNILVSYNGAIKLVDFGVSQSLTQLQTSTENTQLKGKIGYASPEQLEEQPLDHRSDLFSLGVVLWESLTLKRLYRTESPAATVRKILAGNPLPPSQLRPEVPPELDAICLKALTLNPDDRYQSAVEMRDELVGLLREASYHGDERTIAAHMNEAFAQQRAEGERLLRQVADAEEEIAVDLDLGQEAHISVPRGESHHDEELDAVLEVETAGDQTVSTAVAKAEEEPVAMAEEEPVAKAEEEPVAKAEEEPVAKAEEEPPAKAEPCANSTSSTGHGSDVVDAVALPAAMKTDPNLAPPSAFSTGKVHAIEPASLGDVSIKKKRSVLIIILATAALAALGTLAVAIATGSDNDKSEPPVAIEEAKPPVVAPPPPEPDAAILPHMIGVPPARELEAGEEPPAISQAIALYLDGHRLAEADKQSDARIEYRAALRKVEDFSPALRGLAVSYFKENRKSKARYYLVEYLKLAPTAPDVEAMRALLIQLTE